jgi:dephospho-CoA kinase
MARDGISEERARARVRAQKSDAEFRAQCAHLFVNDAADSAAAEKQASDYLNELFKEIKEEHQNA